MLYLPLSPCPPTTIYPYVALRFILTAMVSLSLSPSRSPSPCFSSSTPARQEHLRDLETPQTQEILSHGLMYLICITEVDDPEIFKICLEYWHVFAHELYTSETQLLHGPRCRETRLRRSTGSSGKRTRS